MEGLAMAASKPKAYTAAEALKVAKEKSRKWASPAAAREVTPPADKPAPAGEDKPAPRKSR